jgi:hypothetical protein
VSFDCAECGRASGSSLLCRDCIPLLSIAKKRKYRAAWHRAIVTAANCTCCECGHSAPWESGELAGDHVRTQGSRPDLAFDLKNGRCVCLTCHNRRHAVGLPHPEKPKRLTVQKLPICKVAGCPIFASGTGRRRERCWKHQ